MEISIIFDMAYRGQAAGAVWIVNSDENRRWFDKKSDLDAASALFTPEGGEFGRAAILRSIWNAQEHFPEWSRIIITGVTITDELSRELRDEGDVVVSERGFALIRA